MGFKLDALSLKRLTGVHPDLVRVVKDCATSGVLPFQFGVSEGLRTVAQQRLDVAHGFSQTMKSRHLDGHAADLVPLKINDLGQSVMSWAWPPFYVLAAQMRAASIRQKVPVIWGGVWDTELEKLLDDDMEAESHAYVARARVKGQHGFTDGPHFELPLAEYPAGPPIA